MAHINDFKDYEEYVKNLSIEELEEVLSSINQDQNPERYDIVSKLYEAVKEKVRGEQSISNDLNVKKGSPFIGIVIGSLFDIFGGVVSEFVIPLTYYYFTLVDGVVDKNTVLERIGALSNDPMNIFFSIITLFIVPFLSGFICAVIAKREVVFCAIIVGVCTAIVGIIIGSSTLVEGSFVKSLIRNAISFFFIILGAHAYEEIKHILKVDR